MARPVGFEPTKRAPQTGTGSSDPPPAGGAIKETPRAARLGRGARPPILSAISAGVLELGLDLPQLGLELQGLEARAAAFTLSVSS